MRTHMSTGQTEFASVRKIWPFGPVNRFLHVVGAAWVVGLLLSMALMYGTALASVAASQETKFNPVNVPSVEKMVPNGEYEIYVFTQDQWQPAGRAAYDRFFREEKIDLGGLLSSDRETRIKILQKGGGAAHIDSVFLGETSPVSVEGLENGVKKLSGKDFDVADAFGKEVVVTFPQGSGESTLRLTARVESTTISKTPFQFPTDNLYKQMDINSAFYTYRMNAEKAISPVFKEHSLTGSGHPSGYTYGWARNDDKNLYVKIDFTADNTLDGGKDYAKVYVKTKAGLKEFKVSVPESKWGAADFTYTENVPYQHKVYDFTIPMKELGIADVKQEKELLLAFAAYGTASPQPGPADYSPDSNRYLVVFDSLNDKISGRLVDAAGSAVGSDFVISDAASYKVAPSVAYDSVNHRYLVAWYDNRGYAGNHIYGQLVNTDGSLYGTASDVNFAISTNASYNQLDPEIAFDSANQKYLVVWSDRISEVAYDVYGQLVNADGSPDGSNFGISTAAGNQGAPGVAYDSANTRYLVVWSDNRNAGITSVDIYGQLVNADGTLDGTASAVNFAISTAAEPQDAPKVAYDSVNHRYLVTWSDYRTSPKLVAYGQLVNTDGSLYGTAVADNFAISNALYNARFVSLAYDTARQRYLVAWDDDRNSPATGADIYGQYVNASGSLDQGDFSIIQAAGTQSNPATAYNSGCKNFLVTFRNFGVSNVIEQTVVGRCGQLFGTIGYGYPDGDFNKWNGYCPDYPDESTCYDTSYLVELNPETGAIDQYIGAVGYYVNGLAYDPATNRLYGGTSSNDPTFNGLITIDTDSGVGTPVDTANWGATITNITINTAGQIYGWSEGSDDLVSIDKTTGVATVVGDSGIITQKYGLSFNSADELYLLNSGGAFYLIDTGTGLGTSEGDLDVYPAHHGDFDPFTDLYYGLSGEDIGGSRTLLRCDLLTALCTDVGLVGNLHTLAFEHRLGTVQYELSLNKAGTGTGTVTSNPAGIDCGSDCSESYNSGTEVTLTAAADTGSLFAGWSGDCSGSAATTSVTMDSAKTCTATFSPKPINITSPIGDVSWQAGVNQTISWTYTGNPGAYVKIDLLQNGVVRTIYRRVPIGVGTKTWKPQGKLAGSGYQIRVTSTSNSSYTDTSQGTLTISPR